MWPFRRHNTETITRPITKIVDRLEVHAAKTNQKADAREMRAAELQARAGWDRDEVTRAREAAKTIGSLISRE